MSEVHVVVPPGIDDPARPSGGNTYDRRVCRGLAALGWTVRVHAVHGAWPHPNAGARAALGSLLARLPDGAAVLLDGLVGSTAPDALVPHADRLRLVSLVHMPLGCGEDAAEARAREGAVLRAATAVVTTSGWCRQTLVGLHGLEGERVHVAEPGADAADLAPGTPAGGALLCVAAVIPGKGHDILVDALAAVGAAGWRLACVGSVDRDPAFVRGLHRRIRGHGLERRVSLTGPRSARSLARAYHAADLLVLASRGESYGMVVTEALAAGLPVVAAEVGGVPEALGRGGDGVRPGVLVAPGDPEALAAALRRWLASAELRGRLRRAARERRAALPGWPATVSVIAGVLREAAR